MRVDNFAMKNKLNRLYGIEMQKLTGRLFQKSDINQLIFDRSERVVYVYCPHWKTPRKYTFEALPNMCLEWALYGRYVNVNKYVTIVCRKKYTEGETDVDN